MISFSKTRVGILNTCFGISNIFQGLVKISVESFKTSIHISKMFLGILRIILGVSKTFFDAINNLSWKSLILSCIRFLEINRNLCIDYPKKSKDFGFLFIFSCEKIGKLYINIEIKKNDRNTLIFINTIQWSTTPLC